MRVLLIGGAGRVGRLMLPKLAEQHQVRVFDLQPVAAGGDSWEHIVGDATDPEALAGAVNGVDAVVHCAMPSARGWETPAGAAACFDVQVTSVYLTLMQAHRAGVPHAVYISSMSVYRDLLARRSVTEDAPPDETEVYGLTKRLGERVCQAAAIEHGMSVNVLRLALPTPDEMWPAWQSPVSDAPELKRTDDGVLVPGLAASDLARAVLAALDHRDGFDVFGISGDHERHVTDIGKAHAVLGWRPTFRHPA